MDEGMRPGEVFATRLRETRKARSLSQAELAQQMTEQGRPLRKEALLRIEKEKPSRVVSLDEAIALGWLLQAVPAQLLTPPEGAYLALTDKVGVDGEGLRNWLVYGDPLLAMPVPIDSDQARAVMGARLQRDLTSHAFALVDAVRGKDKAGITAAGEAIVEVVAAYQVALETGRGAPGGLERHTSDDAEEAS
jgi:transcriptional regulator with XRE-family HTH domain